MKLSPWAQQQGITYAVRRGSNCLGERQAMLYVLQLLCVLLLLPLAPASAEIYKWVDRDGGVHFTDTIAGIPLEYRDRIEERTSTTLAPQSVLEPPPTGPERLSVALTPASMSYEVPLQRAGNAMLVEAVVDRTKPPRLVVH